MKILLSNDDGVYAPGIRIVHKILKTIAEVTIVAPLEERSATGHTLTLDSPLRLVEVEKDIYGCSGFPADCALVGIAHLMRESKPDLVISGINKGANLGQDVFYSGTVAAAREAVFRDIPAIAISSVVDFLSPAPKGEDDEHYLTAALFLRDLIRAKGHELLTPLSLLNINVPNLLREKVSGVDLTYPGFRHYSQEILERRDFKGREYYWIGGIYKGFEPLKGSDCQAVEEKKISLSVLNFSREHKVDNELWQDFCQHMNSWPSQKANQEL